MDQDGRTSCGEVEPKRTRSHNMKKKKKKKKSRKEGRCGDEVPADRVTELCG